MTTKQFRRMCSFALRMVPQSIGGKRWQNVVRGHVKEILYRMSIENYGFHYRHIEDWDNAEYNPEKDQYGHSHLLADLPCDHLSTYCWENDLQKEREDRRGNCSVVNTKVGIALRCCIRAAMDVAVEPSGGVVGFTVGDLREMWKGKPLPKWVTSYFDGDIDAAPASAGVWL